MIRVDSRHDENNIAAEFGVAAVPSDDSQDVHAPALGFIDHRHKIGADVPLPASAANGKNQQDVPIARVARVEPGGKTSLPSLIIDSGSQFGNIIDGGTGIDSGKFAEIVHGVTAVART